MEIGTKYPGKRIRSYRPRKSYRPAKTFYVIVSDHKVYGISTSIAGAEAQRRTFYMPFGVLPVSARSMGEAIDVAGQQYLLNERVIRIRDALRSKET